MNKWTKTAGIIFMAAASVYADRATAAKPAKPANSAADKAPATDVKLLEETDPFAAAPTTAPTTGPSLANTENKAPAAPVQVNPDGTFSLNITAGADVVEQLRVIGFQAQSSIIPSKEVHGALPAMDLYNVTVHEALDALLHANGFAWREKGKFIYVYSAKEVAEQEKAARITNTEVFRLYYTPAANAMTMIKPVLSGEAQVAVTTPAKSGIATGTTDVGGNDHGGEDLIVVTDYPENLDKVRQVLKEVDRRPQQIIIEATILRASLSEDNAMGIDFNVVGGVDFSSITHASGQITNANLPTGSAAFAAGQTQSSIGSGNTFSNGVPNGFKVGVVTDNISVFLSALEGVTDTTILANPKVLALNKQKGEVIVGREDGYLTTTTTETSSTQTVEFLKTGTRLIFRPYIADDGFIRMEVHPEDSSGGLQTAANLPFKITTEVTSNVMVKDGHTIVIGGLFRESTDVTRSQVPMLGNLPLAGALFRQQHDTTRREEVIILLTPHILKDDVAYSQISELALKDAEKLRVGVRKGMMWTGRERLAQMHYEKALAEMNKAKPSRGTAMWDLNAATNLNPKFLEAINMKQELTGKEITTSDSSSIRSFVRRSMLVDKAPATQPAAANTPAAAGNDDFVWNVPADDAQQALAAAPATTQPQQQDSNALVAAAATVAMAPPTTAPASQPMAAEQQQSSDDAQAAGDNATKTTVTELPAEPVPSADANGIGDANK
jgi:type IV pilus assembly protein PilQ